MKNTEPRNLRRPSLPYIFALFSFIYAPLPASAQNASAPANIPSALSSGQTRLYPTSNKSRFLPAGQSPLQTTKPTIAPTFDPVVSTPPLGQSRFQPITPATAVAGPSFDIPQPQATGIIQQPQAAGIIQQPQQSQPASPALNVVPPPARPPLPPPPATPEAGPAIVMQSGAAPSMPQAWRQKALLLFKSYNSLDKSSVLSIRLQTAYQSSFGAIVGAFKKAGLTLEALSLSSGHILVSCQNENGNTEKAIIALRQAAPDSDSSASAGTDVRIFCNSRNRALTLTQIKGILTDAGTAADYNSYKTGADSL